MNFTKLIPAQFITSSKSATASSSSSSSVDSKVSKRQAVELAVDIESPPCVLYGSATNSPGSLLSGLFKLRVRHTSETDSQVSRSVLHKNALTKTTSNNGLRKSKSLNQTTLKSFPDIIETDVKESVLIQNVTLQLIQTIYYENPFIPSNSNIQRCKDCKIKKTVLKEWEIQSQPTKIDVGTFSFPFSYLFKGSLPSTSTLGSHSNTIVRYDLIGKASFKDTRGNKKTKSNSSSSPSTPSSTKSKSKSETIKVTMPIPVTRSLLRGPDKNSLRVFPPTELTVSAVIPNVIHPKSQFPIELQVNGITSSDRRWRMRKLSWKLEETTRIRCHSCSKHIKYLKIIEKETKLKEIENLKRKHKPMKRYGDPIPQVRFSVATRNNSPLPRLNNLDLRQNSNINAAGNTNNTNNTNNNDNLNNEPTQDQDTEDQPAGEFIHPSDDALRQEYIQQQQHIREAQIEQELNNVTNLFAEESRILKDGVMKTGWKTDFSDKGHIELIMDIDCMDFNTGVTNPITRVSSLQPYNENKRQKPNMACDLQDPISGIYVSHVLSVEIIVAEETVHYPNGQPIHKSNIKKSGHVPLSTDDQRLAEISPMFANKQSQKHKPIQENEVSSNGTKLVSVPTGAARVLKMQFRLNITERSGLGISWDEEVPPVYQDVELLSPPVYENTSPISTSPIEMVITPDSSELPPLELVNSNSERPIQLFHDENRVEINQQQIQTPQSVTRKNSVTPSSSPQFQQAISIEGNIPNASDTLTPFNTSDVRVPKESEILNTDKITQ
ncbi:hypothetical protein TBLA_0A04630 [Henningerozyma blattae CBS 6284]|uniref:LDB19 N-terminal domain-containing protein n=1 Tax=Henningerozyma blattae (strain ATCC 34711 / CBS 6284 / DSM 70876 / NBRC 10599 / NRRL Y-10934 / UCD 77-7) TaxID=1071380 RepID=I2GVV5_HENB6|nr:hypothetical protein TBLA_0A04630 [Tetrapisispora blattae CBS 6284]CCH58257.1 hypothetical protein TBLA_0A04630 [Tetrapisispora blattae CBS 6284]